MASTDLTNLTKSVGQAIAKRRTGCGLTQEQVAERLGIGVEAVSRIERGVVLPTVARLGEFADIFECNIADLVTETSSRVTDQASHLAGLLSRLGSADRALVLDIVETLIARLGRPRH
ncbi:MAG TPA: helix-turn-helix transcriptional regulator [Bordetella sp.]